MEASISLQALDWHAAQRLSSRGVLILPADPEDPDRALAVARALLPFAIVPHMRAWASRGRRLSVSELLIPPRRQVILEEAWLLRRDEAFERLVRQARHDPDRRLILLTHRDLPDLQRAVSHALAG